MENLYSNLHKKYSLSKTVRFELKPVGKTKENIEKNGILDSDEHRAKIYKKVKKYCDEYHKKFIEDTLKDFNLDNELLNQYFNMYNKEDKTVEDKEQIKEIMLSLRKEISNQFKANEKYKGLLSKDIIQTFLSEIYPDGEEKNEIEEFKKFTTYFKGYNQNRENMYVETEDSTAIAYRLINENLPVFCSNLKIYEKITKTMPNLSSTINQELQEYLQVNSIDEMFQLEYFNETLTQKGIEIYNVIISGKSEENGRKIKGINEYINEFNQQNKDKKLPKLRQLYKQILSDKIGASFVIDSINDDIELVQKIQEYYESLCKMLNSNDERKGIKELIETIDEYDINNIYINSYAITDLSQSIFGEWGKINQAISQDYDENYKGKRKIDTDAYIDERKKYLKNNKEYSIKYLNDLNENKIVPYLKEYLEENQILENIQRNYENVQDVLNKEYKENSREIIKDEKLIEKIKNLLDEIKKLQEYVKIFIVRNDIEKKDELFYSTITELYEQLKEIIPLYNKVRNYVTQKPYSTEKFKINFEIPTLLDGWDANKEKDNLGVLLKKEEKYYLGIINPYNRKIFETYEERNAESYYEKMEYKLLPGPNKMLPKVFFSKSRIQEFNPSTDLLRKYEEGLHKKGAQFDIDFCHELIDFFKDSINKHEDWKNFGFDFSDTNTYNDISEFYREVEKQGYQITFKKYSDEFINSAVEVGDLYLFEIYNKDFSEYSKGKKNLHTIYWNAVFDEDNLKNIVYKLNGQAEIFYRKASLDIVDTAVHPKNQAIKNKNEENAKKESIFDYDLIKDRRYTVDKFQFHVPITMNFISENRNNINEDVNKAIKTQENVNVIGIDRGERNLLYLSVINSKGEILEQNSLNEIINEYNGNTYKVNYHDLLDKKENEHKEQRKSWKTVDSIKELKEGYLSQVIFKIVQLMDKYKAIIVLEDLNKGFKNSRIKVEKQVYQKFEKMLIDKLNYLVIKDKDKFEEGGALNAYQLTNKFESFQKLGKQSGVLFYIPAWNTSKIDPTTGFVNLFYVKYESIQKSKDFISKIDDIKFNENDNYFEFDIDYKKFTNRAFGKINKWTLCTYGDRILAYRNPERDNKKVNLTEEFVNLFRKYNIDYSNIKQEILSIDDKNFYEDFMNLFKLMLQMRNSVTGTDEDWLISPVKNSNNEFYISGRNPKLPKDADANGAYNIARKGLMLVEQIKNTDDNLLGKVKYDISNDEWLKFAQN